MSRVHQLKLETARLKSAIGAIHNHLHADDVNAAHAACECALSGGTVTQPNLSVDDNARGVTFAAEFNALAERHEMLACCIVLVPSATIPNAVSLQMMGNVAACKIIEEQIRGRPSTYMGDHAPPGGSDAR